ncbi:DNA/RNA non-specific endonuclease [Pseudidiomarina sp. WS423]|uniref:DNA/RNA non-specific endonuclease n=1 Tax=Pseudidiomarina sp. WS423 TaxID=3425124 RepID=UPI003D6EA46D
MSRSRNPVTYTNITPQASGLNQGPWARLENAVRQLARSGQDVYVVTGPLHEWHFASLPGTTVSNGRAKMSVYF